MLFAVPEQVIAGSPHRHRIASALPRFRRAHRPGVRECVTLSINGARLTADAQETSFLLLPSTKQTSSASTSLSHGCAVT
jgi:hypothetical protein